MLQKIQEHWYFAAAGAAVVVLLLLFHKWKSQQKKKKEQYEKRMKDQALNEALKNNFGRRNAFRQSQSATPLEQQDVEKTENDSQGLIVMKLQVLGKDKKSYVVSPEEHVLLGSTEGMNDVVLNDKNIAPQQCDIFLHKEHVYVRNLNLERRMVLTRKGGQMELGEQGVQVLTGDILYMGNSRIQITLMDYMGNTIAG